MKLEQLDQTKLRPPFIPTESTETNRTPTIAVIIPCFKVKRHILGVLNEIGSEVAAIYCVDDGCPEGSAKFIQENCKDNRVKVLVNPVNLGVGGAMKHGYKTAIADGHQILVKIDGDGQMDPTELHRLVSPILNHKADYTKGNRFYCPRALRGMPLVRILGNAGLSFMSKLSSGYWQIMDPTNGFTAIHSQVYLLLEGDRLSDRYFFESDVLFRLHLVGALVKDIPMPARYGDEVSNLKISNTIFIFSWMHIKRFLKRIVYDYFVHDFNIGSLQLVFGLAGFLFGLIYGVQIWMHGNAIATPNSIGAIMIATIPMILGFQLLLSFLYYDIALNRGSKDCVHE
jgi:dolichol-phosphate mannosyltransferase